MGCPQSEVIEGGNVSYSLGGNIDSVLAYHCKEGWYPYPTNNRVCTAEREWSTLRLPNGRPTNRAICKEMQCPAQLQLHNGHLWPRKTWFSPGESQQFWCNEGYTLYGSELRNCTKSGEWTGTTAVCDDRVDDCVNPGAPPGSLRSGDRFRVGEKVQYRCQMGLNLLGSSERVCMDTREWSGSEPRCQSQFAFDSPSVVESALAASLSAVMELSTSQDSNQKKTALYGRTIRIEDDGKLNVYILLDTSGSIKEDDFQQAKKAVESLINKLDSYEVQLNYEVISYASDAKEIVSILDPESNNVDYVLHNLVKFHNTAHGKRTGTNLNAALTKVYENMAFLKEDRKNKFNQTRHVILIVSDGHSNTGANPKFVLSKIRYLLGYTQSDDNTSEEYLDIYVFGVGSSINKKELNSIASKKTKEEHLFSLKDYKDLGQVFDNMITDSQVSMCGVTQEGKGGHTSPWHVEIKTVSSERKETCKGSLVTQNWVLTAAHCFTLYTIKNPDKVSIIHGLGTAVAESIHLHPQYNISGLQHKKIKEFYDYDVAVVKVKNKITLSEKSRPICLPCTTSSNRALKKKTNTSCDEHMKDLFELEEIPAYFLTKADQTVDPDKLVLKKLTHIQYGSKREACEENAKVTFDPDSNATLSEVVTDRFLCSGGSAQYKDTIACKGDSGGSLFIQKKRRYFQVAVVSWGTRNVCSKRDSPPKDARDFHINIFSVLPWLRQHLDTELTFLPLVI
ncbi:CFAB factor, partial [Amia calva]|nr:CFAB factor [Amia calva]